MNNFYFHDLDFYPTGNHNCLNVPNITSCRLTLYCGAMRGNNTWDDPINYYFQWNWNKSIESSYNSCLANYKELKQNIRSDIDNGWIILEKDNPYLNEIMSDELSLKELIRFVKIYRDYVKLMSSNNNLIMEI